MNNSGGGDGGGTGGSYTLAVLGPTPNATTTGGKQRAPPRQPQPPPPNGTASVLRFAYARLHDIRGGATLEAGLRGQGSKASAGVSVAGATGAGGVADNGPGLTGKRDSGLGTAGGDGEHDGRRCVGDEGSWNASMQALCAMLRARRRDPALVGLVFLALEACIGEWSHACDSGWTSQQAVAKTRARGGWRPLQFTATVAGAAGVGTGISATKKEGGNDSPSSLSNLGEEFFMSSSGGSTAGGVSPQGGGVLEQRRLAQAAVVAHGRVCAGPREKGASTTAEAREKMELGIRESLKASLVWAEAIPLGRSRAAASDGSDHRRSNGGGGGAIIYQGSQVTATETAVPEVSLGPAMAEAVERLSRWLHNSGLSRGS